MNDGSLLFLKNFRNVDFIELGLGALSGHQREEMTGSYADAPSPQRKNRKTVPRFRPQELVG
jgi:hypothetical protein